MSTPSIFPAPGGPPPECDALHLSDLEEIDGFIIHEHRGQFARPVSEEIIGLQSVKSSDVLAKSIVDELVFSVIAQNSGETDEDGDWEVKSYCEGEFERVLRAQAEARKKEARRAEKRSQSKGYLSVLRHNAELAKPQETRKEKPETVVKQQQPPQCDTSKGEVVRERSQMAGKVVLPVSQPPSAVQKSRKRPLPSMPWEEGLQGPFVQGRWPVQLPSRSSAAFSTAGFSSASQFSAPSFPFNPDPVTGTAVEEMVFSATRTSMPLPNSVPSTGMKGFAKSGAEAAAMEPKHLSPYPFLNSDSLLRAPLLHQGDSGTPGMRPFPRHTQSAQLGFSGNDGNVKSEAWLSQDARPRQFPLGQLHAFTSQDKASSHTPHSTTSSMGEFLGVKNKTNCSSSSEGWKDSDTSQSYGVPTHAAPRSGMQPQGPSWLNPLQNQVPRAYDRQPSFSTEKDNSHCNDTRTSSAFSGCSTSNLSGLRHSAGSFTHSAPTWVPDSLFNAFGGIASSFGWTTGDLIGFTAAGNAQPQTLPGDSGDPFCSSNSVNVSRHLATSSSLTNACQLSSFPTSGTGGVSQHRNADLFPAFGPFPPSGTPQNLQRYAPPTPMVLPETGTKNTLRPLCSGGIRTEQNAAVSHALHNAFGTSRASKEFINGRDADRRGIHQHSSVPGAQRHPYPFDVSRLAATGQLYTGPIAMGLGTAYSCPGSFPLGPQARNPVGLGFHPSTYAAKPDSLQFHGALDQTTTTTSNVDLASLIPGACKKSQPGNELNHDLFCSLKEVANKQPRDATKASPSLSTDQLLQKLCSDIGEDAKKLQLRCAWCSKKGLTGLRGLRQHMARHCGNVPSDVTEELVRKCLQEAVEEAVSRLREKQRRASARSRTSRENDSYVYSGEYEWLNERSVFSGAPTLAYLRNMIGCRFMFKTKQRGHIFRVLQVEWDAESKAAIAYVCRAHVYDEVLNGEKARGLGWHRKDQSKETIVGVWVSCDRCDKWRRVEKEPESDHWYCEMKGMRCSDPQEMLKEGEYDAVTNVMGNGKALNDSQASTAFVETGEKSNGRHGHLGSLSTSLSDSNNYSKKSEKNVPNGNDFARVSILSPKNDDFYDKAKQNSVAFALDGSWKGQLTNEKLQEGLNNPGISSGIIQTHQMIYEECVRATTSPSRTEDNERRIGSPVHTTVASWEKSRELTASPPPHERDNERHADSSDHHLIEKRSELPKSLISTNDSKSEHPPLQADSAGGKDAIQSNGTEEIADGVQPSIDSSPGRLLSKTGSSSQEASMLIDTDGGKALKSGDERVAKEVRHLAGAHGVKRQTSNVAKVKGYQYANIDPMDTNVFAEDAEHVFKMMVWSARRLEIEYGTSDGNGLGLSPEEMKALPRQSRTRRSLRGTRKSRVTESSSAADALRSSRRRLRQRRPLTELCHGARLASAPTAGDYTRNTLKRKRKRLQKLSRKVIDAAHSESEWEDWEDESQPCSKPLRKGFASVKEADSCEDADEESWMGPQHDSMCFMRGKQNTIKMRDYRMAKAKVWRFALTPRVESHSVDTQLKEECATGSLLAVETPVKSTALTGEGAHGSTPMDAGKIAPSALSDTGDPNGEGGASGNQDTLRFSAQKKNSSQSAIPFGGLSSIVC